MDNVNVNTVSNFVTNTGIILSMHSHPEYGRSVELRRVLEVTLKSSLSANTKKGITSVGALINPSTKVKETRVMFDRVSDSLKDKSDEEVLQVYLDTLNQHGLFLVKVSSLFPIITDKVKLAMDRKFITEEDVAERQRAYKKGDGGELIPATYKGYEFYTTYMLKSRDKDTDLRDAEIAKMAEAVSF